MHSLNIFNRQANLYWVSLFSVGLDFDTFELFFKKKFFTLPLFFSLDKEKIKNKWK